MRKKEKGRKQPETSMQQQREPKQQQDCNNVLDSGLLLRPTCSELVLSLLKENPNTRLKRRNLGI